MNLKLEMLNHYAVRVGVVALLYYLTAQLGLQTALVGDSVSLFWLASGVALTALIHYGYRIWPGIFLGAWMGNIAESALIALAIASGATLAAVVGAWILNRSPSFNRALVTLQDVFVLLAAAAVSAVVSALNGAFWLQMHGSIVWQDYANTALMWWMGDTLGMILFVPLALAWLSHKPLPSPAKSWIELAACFGSLMLVCLIVFVGFHAELLSIRIGSVVLLPIIVWSALRFNMRFTALALMMVFCFSIYGIMHDTGTFAPMTQQSISEIYIYNLIMSMTGLVLSVSNYQRRFTSRSLEQKRADLERAQAAAQTGSWSLDISSRQLTWSDETYRIFGMPLHSVLTPQAFFHHACKEDRERVQAIWEDVLQGQACDIEYRIQQDDHVQWIHLKSDLEANLDGPAVMIGTCRDITPLRETEKRLHLSTKVFDNSGEGILITDADARIIAANTAFSAMTGYTESELVGNTPHILSSGLHDQNFYREMWHAIKNTGRWQGEIWDRHKSGRVYPSWMSINAVRDEAGNNTHYIAISKDITERKEAEKHIHQLAYYDVLTGLPNRTLLHDRLEQMLLAARRDQGKFALLFMDLDRFKYINDSMGHSAGDKLLRSVALRLQDCVREGDTVARLGGDEFILLLRESDMPGAVIVANKILLSLSAPFTIDHKQIATHASIGISLYPDHADTADMLIKHADVAMYRAKDKGRNNYQLYAPEMMAHANRVFWMEADLRLALERNEFLLHYQPQVALSSGAICGAEVLLRWKHPEKGYIPPSEFIPVAEETGQIVEIGEWVLRTACQQLAQWRREGMAAFPISVNVSIRQFDQPDLAQKVAEILTETGLQPVDLELELTEGMMIGDAQMAMSFLAQMHTLGVRLAIDDFGTGFSSLNYLKRLPLDRLKIDQSFVRDIETDQNDAAIVRSIIGLGHRLKLRIIAEGVETLEQLYFLRIRGCDEVQGYYISPPLPAQEFAKFIQSMPNLNDDLARAMA